MANETMITVMGRLTEDPQLRFTPNGTAVANLTIAVTARRFNRQSNEWEDKTTRFWRCSAWNSGKLTLAENATETLKKGDSVIAYGEIEARDYETKEGERRTVVELRLESIGKDARFHKAPGGGSAQQPPAHQGGAYGVPQSNQPQQGNGGGWSSQPQHGGGPQPQQNGGGGWNQQQPTQQQHAQNGAGGWNAPANDPWATGGANPASSQQQHAQGGWGNQ